MTDYPVFRVIGSFAQMRADPSHQSAVVSQALFSEEVRLLDRAGGWAKVETVVDGYAGWVEEKEIGLPAKSYISRLERGSVWVDRLSAHLYSVKDTVYGPLLTLPMESRLALAEPCVPGERWLHVVLPDGREAFIQKGDVASSRPMMTMEALCAYSLSFLGLPYTWGGRSSFGYDCSGFVQMLYRMMAIPLPRDSKDQVRAKGFTDVGMDTVSAGDLLFFGHASDAVKHVGMALGNGEFIHTCASVENAPYLRISSLKDPAWDGGGYYPYRLARRLTENGIEG